MTKKVRRKAQTQSAELQNQDETQCLAETVHTESSSDADVDPVSNTPSKPSPSEAYVDRKAGPLNNDRSGAKSSDSAGLLRWRNWWTRAFTTLLMVTTFAGILYAGHLAVVLLVVVIQTLVFREVIGIAYGLAKKNRLPWFRALNWYLLGSTNYFLYGESIIHYFKKTVIVDEFLLPLASYHRFISFMLYCIGFVLFVVNLKPDYKFQLSMFAWTHMTLLLVVFTSHFTINNIFEGLFWFILPVSLVICNDVMAYIFGFFFGRTPLIRLSPKKTWEGFLGALVCTFIFAFFFSGYLAQFPYLRCPIPSSLGGATAFHPETVACNNIVFLPVEQPLTPMLSRFLGGLFMREIKTVAVAPVQYHSMFLAGFASLIAPFGGFFASGVKRAFQLKDYSDLIPGHGGVTDRMDCQLLMGFFANMYIQAFVGNAGMEVGQILQMILEYLTSSQQVELYQRLGDYLDRQGLLQP
ncbi:cytidylyltransferase family-domain-containing protein [Cladochytrium replicatum]|nr:cytidylyltransferase family-domain-containing protein [Cladochytrium replicatum]